jgi:hypothetical protein
MLGNSELKYFLHLQCPLTDNGRSSIGCVLLISCFHWPKFSCTFSLALPLSSAGVFLFSLFYPEDRGNMFLRNVVLSTNYTMLQQEDCNDELIFNSPK